jgi:cysteine synthase A
MATTVAAEAAPARRICADSPLLTAYGAQVNLVSEPHPTGGWQQARRERVKQLMAQHPGSWCPDQYNNPDNITAYTPLALELATEMGHLDVLVCSVGTGGHSAGVSRVLKQLYPELKVVGVDTIGSTIFGQPARPRLMRGLGSSIYPRNVAYENFSARCRWKSGGWAETGHSARPPWRCSSPSPD